MPSLSQNYFRAMLLDANAWVWETTAGHFEQQLNHERACFAENQTNKFMKKDLLSKAETEMKTLLEKEFRDRPTPAILSNLIMKKMQTAINNNRIVNTSLTSKVQGLVKKAITKYNNNPEGYQDKDFQVESPPPQPTQKNSSGQQRGRGNNQNNTPPPKRVRFSRYNTSRKPNQKQKNDDNDSAKSGRNNKSSDKRKPSNANKPNEDRHANNSNKNRKQSGRRHQNKHGHRNPKHATGTKHPPNPSQQNSKNKRNVGKNAQQQQNQHQQQAQRNNDRQNTNDRPNALQRGLKTARPNQGRRYI